MLCECCETNPIQNVATVAGLQLCKECAMMALPLVCGQFQPIPKTTEMAGALEWLDHQVIKDCVRAHVAPSFRMAA